jgi:hypothetical protein
MSWKEWLEDESRLHNMAEIHILIDCGNCPLSESEKIFFDEKIRQMLASQSMVIKDIEFDS